MTTFEIGDIVLDSSKSFVGIVCTDGSVHDGRYTWEVFWNDGDTTHYEDGESMSHHKIKPEQWTVTLIKKYMDIICP
jgi:ubiquitin C-terminal hydrolase